MKSTQLLASKNLSEIANVIELNCNLFNSVNVATALNLLSRYQKLKYKNAISEIIFIFVHFSEMQSVHFFIISQESNKQAHAIVLQLLIDRCISILDEDRKIEVRSLCGCLSSIPKIEFAWQSENLILACLRRLQATVSNFDAQVEHFFTLITQHTIYPGCCNWILVSGESNTKSKQDWGYFARCCRR